MENLMFKILFFREILELKRLQGLTDFGFQSEPEFGCEVFSNSTLVKAQTLK